MSRQFSVLNDAIEAGYVKRIDGYYYRGFGFGRTDTSGGSSRGYSYAMKAYTLHDDESLINRCDMNPVASQRLCDILSQEYASSRTVWLTDVLNKIRQPGAFSVMFLNSDVEVGFERAKILIDRYRAVKPEPLTLREKINLAKTQAPISDMYQALIEAARAGHPSVRFSKTSEEPIFCCDFPRWRSNGEWWSSESAQLAYLDADLAAEQMSVAGIEWEVEPLY
jgi:hypothetical protein